jgi:hypothetical protein
MNQVADIRKMAASGTVSDEDVLALRRAMYGNDHVIDAAEADALFELNDAADGACAAWPAFFVEAVTDYCVHQTEPAGYVTEDMAGWLIARVSRSGVVKTSTELELLIKVMETSRTVPAKLEDFALKQVHEAVMSGAGVTRSGEQLEPGQIGRGEVELLRRILYAAGGNDGLAVSRREAELLFDINDAVTSEAQDPAWADLFVKAIANYLMAERGRKPVSRAEALRREAWLDDTNASVGDFFGRILSGGLRGILDAAGHDQQAEQAEANRKRLQDIAMAEQVNAGEADWLVGRINRDGELHDAEKALLMFIKRESPDIDPALKPLLERVA